MRGAVRNKERWKGAVRLPRILVLIICYLAQVPFDELAMFECMPAAA